MKKSIIKLLCLIFISHLIFGCTSKPTYMTLEEAVKNKLSTNEIKILNEYTEKNLALCLNRSQYILGIYSYNNGVYDYFNVLNKSDGTDSNIFIIAEHIEKVGNIIWGTLSSEEHVDKFIIEYSNGEIQHVASKNNTFISYMPTSLQDVQSVKLRAKILNVLAVNESDQILDKLKTYNIADPIMVMLY